MDVGDVVKLKSGGASMTVIDAGEIDGQRYCWCTWMTAQGESKTEMYPTEAMTQVQENDA